MSKTIPLLYGSYYHIYNRGINGTNIFVAERNYPYFLNLYAKYILPIADTYAYNLLRNHFHFGVRIKTLDEQEEWYYQQFSKRPYASPPPWVPKKPSQQFGNLFNAYTKAFNKMYYRTGALFERPFSRIKVTSILYLKRLIIYINQNAQLHGFVDDFRDWLHSSYHSYLSEKPTRLEREQTLAWFNGRLDFQSLHNDMLLPSAIPTLVEVDFSS